MENYYDFFSLFWSFIRLEGDKISTRINEINVSVTKDYVYFLAYDNLEWENEWVLTRKERRRVCSRKWVRASCMVGPFEN